MGPDLPKEVASEHKKETQTKANTQSTVKCYDPLESARTIFLLVFVCVTVYVSLFQTDFLSSISNICV